MVPEYSKKSPNILYRLEHEAPTEPGWYYCRARWDTKILPREVKQSWWSNNEKVLIVVDCKSAAFLSDYKWFGPALEVVEA